MTIAAHPITACATATDVFCNPLLEDGVSASSTAEQRRAAAVLAARAAAICAECPLMSSCLYDAVVEHDVAGVAGGTTARQRQTLRSMLRVTVEPEDFDTLAGVVGRNRQVDHDEVVRLRNANPHESLETIAMRLGCSLSTVKRHLRRARAEATKPMLAAVPPSVEQVMAAHAELTGKSGRSLRKVA